MNDIFLGDLMELVSQRSGLRLSEQDKKGFRKKLAERIKILGFSDPEEYGALLRDPTPAGESEWNEFLETLTNGESYFFRDSDQFFLLKHTLFPEMIARQKEGRRLRLWSAGCSSGEEPYSLGIILKELIPNLDSWDIRIFGTDISEKAINRAKGGIFSPWSLRKMAPEIRSRYFSPRGDFLVLDEGIRRMVSFGRSNLLEENIQESFPELKALDLILCRNVFIYFHEQALSRVVSTFTRFLKDDGYLITGHGELFGRNLGIFHPEIREGQVVYQKKSESNLSAGPRTLGFSTSPEAGIPKKEKTDLQKNPHPIPRAREVEKDPPPIAPKCTAKASAGPLNLAAIRAEFEKGNLAEVIKMGRTLPDHSPDRFEALLLMAEASSNSGLYDEADTLCRKAGDLDPGSPRPLFLLAQLMEARGNLQEAKRFLKKTIYVAPENAAAYLELGNVYASEEDFPNAGKMYSAALELLKRVPAEIFVSPFAGMSANDIIRFLEKRVAEIISR